MAKKTESEAKTAAGPMTDEELERLTAPGAIASAAEAFAAGAGIGQPTETAPVDEPVNVIVGDAPAQVAAQESAAAKQSSKKESPAPKFAADRVTELRAELMAEIASLRAELSGLKSEDDGYMWTIMRGSIYCPECKCQLDGGSMTSQFDSPYVHPSGSAASKPCKFLGKKFEKPRVKTRPLP